MAYRAAARRASTVPTLASTGGGRCDALLLLSDCFYLLRAFFCAADVDALFPRERSFCSGGPAPVLLPDAVLQGALRIEHGAWAPVHSACLCREAHLRVPQPHYTLCTLQRERHPDRPSIYRLLSEHDGRLMLVAQQSGPGEDRSWCIGALVHWRIGALVHWCIGVLWVG